MHLTFGVKRTIDVPNEVVWRVLGDFGSEHLWTESVSECRRDTAGATLKRFEWEPSGLASCPAR